MEDNDNLSYNMNNCSEKLAILNAKLKHKTHFKLGKNLDSQVFIIVFFFFFIIIMVDFFQSFIFCLFNLIYENIYALIVFSVNR